MIALALSLTYAGFLALCLSMPRHQRETLHKSLTPGAASALRYAGFLALTGAFVAATVHAGWQVGSVLWIALLTAGAMLVVLLRCYAPRRMVGVAAVLIPLSLMAVLVSWQLRRP